MMDKKLAWKELGKIKDPIVRAYIENALQENATLKKGLEAYKATGFTPEQISAGTTVTFDIGNDGFLTAINSAFKERFGITADDVPKIIAERDTLKTALELAAEHIAKSEIFPDSLQMAKGNAPFIAEHFTKQAQQLTHETHGESEAKK